jgi:thioredoxin 1
LDEFAASAFLINKQVASFSSIINSEKPVLVDFFTQWCGPCKLMGLVLKDLKKQVGNKATILKIDVDKSPQSASTFNIQGVPTFILFKQGEIKWRHSGIASVKTLQQVINQYS